MTRYIKTQVLRELVADSDNKCANYPNSDVIKNYNCPMWIINNGLFDESGYNVDHKEEFSKTHNNEKSNLQLLCLCCHAVKTRRFRKNKNIFTTSEIDKGKALMDVEPPTKKRRGFSHR
jgi:hypothetical protein